MSLSRRLSIVLALTLSGCGDDASGGGQGGASAGTAAEGTSTSSTESGAGADPSGGGGSGKNQGGAGGSLEEPTRAATVSVTDQRYPQYPERGEVGNFYGAFGQELPDSGPDDRESLGDCYFASYEVDTDAPGVELAELEHLEVEGTLVPITPARSSDGSYRAMVEQPLLAPGLEVRFTGGGSGAPTMDLSLQAPSRVSLLGPDLEGGLARDADATFTWDVVGDAGGEVGVSIGALRNEGAAVIADTIFCSVPIDVGEVVVPVEFLERLPGEEAFLGVGATKTTETQVEDWRVLFVLGQYLYFELALVGDPVE